MQLHVRVQGFDNEDFAVQLAMIFTSSTHAYKFDEGLWVIGDSKRLMEVTDITLVDPDDDEDDEGEFEVSESIAMTWRRYRIEFNDNEFKGKSLELLRQTILAYVPDAQFFDPGAVLGAALGPAIEVDELSEDEGHSQVSSLLERLFDPYDESDIASATV